MTSTIMLFFSILILVSVHCNIVEALIGVQMPQLLEPSKTLCSQLFLSTTNDDDSSSADDISSSVQDRREFLSLGANRMWVLGGGVAAAFAAVPPSSVEALDPFSELDDIAAKIKLENSNYPNSISPLPTYKTTERELISDDDTANTGAATQNSADQPKSASDLDKALQNMKKQKQIDPRTHG